MSIYESYDKIIYMFSCSDNYTSDLQNLQKSIRTCADLTKINSDMCRTYKIRFGHVQNLHNSIRTCAELTKINSDMCRTYKIGQKSPQNSDKCVRPSERHHCWVGG